MKTKLLVVAMGCLSIAAVAQQTEKKNDVPVSHEVKSPRDLATGQASGRKMNQKPEEGSTSANTTRETGGKKTMAHDDWNAQTTANSGDPHVTNASAAGTQTAVRESPSKASIGRTEVRESPSRPSTGQPGKVATDLDGDGTPDKTASGGSVKSPRDSSTGQASGKRQQGTAKEQMEKNPRN